MAGPSGYPSPAMAAIQVVLVPYDSGRRGERLGAGPLALLEGGVGAALAGAGHAVEVETIELEEAFTPEVPAAVELQRGVAAAVRRASAADRLPVLLAGNCNLAALGALGGLGSGTAVLWLDAHGDFNTPETSPSGYFDGMTLAVATGRCFRGAASGFDGLETLADERIALLGVRDLDPPEERALAASGVTRLAAAELARLAALLAAWAAAGLRLYLHIDLDVLDPTELVANPWAVPGGLSRDELADVLDMVRRTLPPAAIGFTAYGPGYDREARGAGIVAAALDRLLVP